MNFRGMSLLVGLLVALPATVSEARTEPSAVVLEVSAVEQAVGSTGLVDRSAVRVATREQASEFSVLVTVGEEHTCVIDEGDVYCWGDNSYGQLGLGDDEDRGDDAGEMGDSLPPVDLGAGRTATAISAGGYHTCALLDDGSVKCWGSNDDGGLGLGDDEDRGDGAGEMGDSLPPVDLGEGRTAVAVSTGYEFTCALLDDGSVKCWGYNSDGQLGLGDDEDRGDDAGEMGDSLPPVDLGAGRTATAISAGRYHTCALLDDGSVKCWGNNDDGGLGLGDTDSRGDDAGEMGDALPSIDLGEGRTAVAVSTGYEFTCALLDDGSVKCWGYNSYGQLGLGDDEDRGDDAGEMGDSLPPVDLGEGRTAVAVSTGYEFTCALLDDGSVKCWGNNGSGALGLGDSEDRGDDVGEMGDALPTVDLGDGGTAVSIAAYYEHTCALLDDGSVKCWGDNGSGQLGLGDTYNRGQFNDGQSMQNVGIVDLGSGRTATALSVGTNHACATLDNGSLKCWGRSGSGQLGLADTFSRGDDPGEMGDLLPAVDLGSIDEIFSVSLGNRLSCAVVDTGFILGSRRVKCWGYNGSGALGLGDSENRGDDAGEMGDALPMVDLGSWESVLGLTFQNSPRVISSGYFHVCAIYSGDGLVKCWGGNAWGQLGLGDDEFRGNNAGEMGNSLPPVDLGAGRTASAISAGFAHTCSLLDDGSVKCWGGNSKGQLGLGDTNDRGLAPDEMGDLLPAVELGSGRTAVAISAGLRHSCAILDDGSVKCWGDNGRGQLGLGDEEPRGDGAGEMGDSLPPVDLGAGRTATSISAGGYHTCALLDDGSVKCWGSNFSGQLGIDKLGAVYGLNQMGDDLPSVYLGEGRTATSIELGSYYSCALLDDGSVKCWGDNWAGQLGLGDEEDRGRVGDMGDSLPAVRVLPEVAAVFAGAGGSFVALTPKRLLDTRSGDMVGELDGSGSAYELQVTGKGGVPGSGVSAVALNVTAVSTETNDFGGFVTVYPCGTRPDASNLNFTSGMTIPNSVIAPVSGSGKVCFYVYGKTHLLADVSGYFPE